MAKKKKKKENNKDKSRYLKTENKVARSKVFVVVAVSFVKNNKIEQSLVSWMKKRKSVYK